MEERMTYTADPEERDRTVLRQEMIVTVQGVPLTSYMEGIIVNTVSGNSSKGKAAIEWVVEKLGQECKALNLLSSLDKLKSEIVDLKHSVAESLITPAKKSIEDLQSDLSKRINLEELKINLDSLNLDKLQLPSPQLVSAEEQKAGR